MDRWGALGDSCESQIHTSFEAQGLSTVRGLFEALESSTLGIRGRHCGIAFYIWPQHGFHGSGTERTVQLNAGEGCVLLEAAPSYIRRLGGRPFRPQSVQRKVPLNIQIPDTPWDWHIYRSVGVVVPEGSMGRHI